MSDQDHSDRNPLRMKTIGPEGAYVLPNVMCSKRRQEYFERANEILGFYATISFYSAEGQKTIEAAAKCHNIVDSTPFRILMKGPVIEGNYGTFRNSFQTAGAQLTNQVFLMIYGNFEAFLLDLVLDGLVAVGETDAREKAVQLMYSARWQGKLDSISQKLGVPLGKHSRSQKFRQVEMRFLGELCVDPVDFLQKMADLRHRLVHSTGRADSQLISMYPAAGLHDGGFIALPFALPIDVHFFFVLLTDFIDESFAKRFGWTRTSTASEKLLRKNQ